jgi:triosephosphate isomerase
MQTLAAQVAGSTPEGENPVIAYEPVWAIGTGVTPGPQDVASAHAFIRSELDRKAPGLGARTRILYGGSVTPANAAELLSAPEVNGALVGGASLRAADFMAIAGFYRR